MKYGMPILFGALCIILFSACPGGKCEHDGFYEFNLPATLSPALNTFRIRDTISISSVFPDDVREVNSGNTYHLEDFKFYPGISIMKIDSNPAVDGLQFFETLIPETQDYYLQTYSNGDQFLIGEYQYKNNLYTLSFSLIPKTPGLYYIIQATTLYPSGKWQTFPEKCPHIAMEARVTLNEGNDNNIHYLSLSPDTYYNDWILQKPDVRFHKGGGYCFIVAE